MIRHYLGDIPKETGWLFAGGGALNVKLNQKIIARPDLKGAVRPAGFGRCRHGDWRRRVCLRPARRCRSRKWNMSISVLPQQRGCDRRLRRHPGAEVAADRRWRPRVPRRIARILADGQPVAWFQGRMEFGPRAWEPFDPRLPERPPASPTGSTSRSSSASAGARSAPRMLDTVGRRCFRASIRRPSRPSPSRSPRNGKPGCRVVHEDGTSRAQVLREFNPRYYDPDEGTMENLTGNGVVLNTPSIVAAAMICSPTDASTCSSARTPRYLIMEDVLVVKPVNLVTRSAAWLRRGGRPRSWGPSPPV